MVTHASACARAHGLVLSRSAGQTILIGHAAEIEVHVVEICGRHVRLRINAPRELPVDRREVHARKIRDKIRDNRRAPVEA